MIIQLYLAVVLNSLTKCNMIQTAVPNSYCIRNHFCGQSTMAAPTIFFIIFEEQLVTYNSKCNVIRHDMVLRFFSVHYHYILALLVTA